MRKQLLALVVLLIFAIGLTAYFRTVKGSTASSGRSFVATFSYYKVDEDPEASEVWIEKVTSTGKAKITTYRSVNGELQPLALSPPFAGWTTPQYSADMWQQFSSEGLLQARSDFVRKDTICGLTAYVIKAQIGPDTVERWYACETGPVPLKTIVDRGADGTLIAEATKIEFRNVSEKELE